VKSTTTAMEATTTASAMPSIGHLRLEYRAGTEQNSREATQSFPAPVPNRRKAPVAQFPSRQNYSVNLIVLGPFGLGVD
jgi:hypothetical protein